MYEHRHGHCLRQPRPKRRLTMGRLQGRGLGSRIGSGGQSRLGARPDKTTTSQGDHGDRDRFVPWRAWYKTARWQKLRLEVLKRDGFKCQATGVALIGKYPAHNSPVADHKTPHRGDPDLFWDINNIQAVSKEYHDGEKQRLEHASGQ